MSAMKAEWKSAVCWTSVYANVLKAQIASPLWMFRSGDPNNSFYRTFQCISKALPTINVNKHWRTWPVNNHGECEIFQNSDRIGAHKEEKWTQEAMLINITLLRFLKRGKSKGTRHRIFTQVAHLWLILIASWISCLGISTFFISRSHYLGFRQA